MNYSVFYRNLNTNSVISILEKNKIDQNKIDQSKSDQNKIDQSKSYQNLESIRAKDKNEYYEKNIQLQKNEVINSFYFDDFF